MPRTHQEFLLPVKPVFIVLTLTAALLANLLPWSGVLSVVRPDFVALTVLYWCVHQPHKFGFTAAFILGLFVDTADASLFGQHALAYSVLAYAGIVLHRRVQSFSGWSQVFHVLALLLLTNLMVLVIRLVAGDGFPGFGYFAGSLTGAALWPALCALLRLPQIPKTDPTHV